MVDVLTLVAAPVPADRRRAGHRDGGAGRPPGRPGGREGAERARCRSVLGAIAHHITGSAAWVAALVMMALADVVTRLAVIYLRGRRLASGPAAAPALIPAGTRA